MSFLRFGMAHILISHDRQFQIPKSQHKVPMSEGGFIFLGQPNEPPINTRLLGPVSNDVRGWSRLLVLYFENALNGRQGKLQLPVIQSESGPDVFVKLFQPFPVGVVSPKSTPEFIADTLNFAHRHLALLDGREYRPAPPLHPMGIPLILTPRF